MLVSIKTFILKSPVKDEEKGDEICTLTDHERATVKFMPYSDLKVK